MSIIVIHRNSLSVVDSTASTVAGGLIHVESPAPKVLGYMPDFTGQPTDPKPRSGLIGHGVQVIRNRDEIFNHICITHGRASPVAAGSPLWKRNNIVFRAIRHVREFLSHVANSVMRGFTDVKKIWLQISRFGKTGGSYAGW